MSKIPYHCTIGMDLGDDRTGAGIDNAIERRIRSAAASMSVLREPSHDRKM